MTAGQAILSEIFPADIYRPGQEIDKKSVNQLFGELARKYPDKYAAVTTDAVRFGERVARMTGGASFTLEHLATPKGAQKRRQRLHDEITKILQTAPPEKQDDLIVQAIQRVAAVDTDATLQEAIDAENPLTELLRGAGRGNPKSLARLIASDLMYSDSDGKPLPIPVLNSYSHGLTPTELVAGAFGARRGVTEAKLCLRKGTQVALPDGTSSPIEELLPGDLVVGVDADGKTRPVTVNHLFNNGNRLVYRYTFRKGSTRSFATVEATANHQILARHVDPGRRKNQDDRREIRKRQLAEAVPASKPGKNSFTAIPVSGSSCDWGDKHEPLAMIIGLMLGDGCVSESTRGTYQISIGQGDLVEPYRQLFAEHGAVLTGPYSGGFSYILGLPADVRAEKFKEHSVGGIRKKGQFCSVKRRIKAVIGEKKSHEKRLPADIWRWDDESVAKLVAGLITTDGCVFLYGNQCGVNFASSSVPLITELHRLLSIRYGIWASSLTQSHRERENPIWSLNVSTFVGFSRLYQLIRPYMLGEKASKMDEVAEAKQLTSDSKRMYGWKLYSVELVGEEPTYDIEVDHEDHLFALANGLVVSNSVASSGYLCFPGDTLVRMADGSTKPIKLIEQGDFVLGADMQGRTYPVEVEKRWDNGIKEVHEYELRLNGQRSTTTMQATPEHNVLLVCDARIQHSSPFSDVPGLGEYKKVPIGELRKGYRLAVSGQSSDWSGTKAEPLAWLYGYLIGNGCLSNGSVNFSTADDSVVQHISENLLKGKGFTVRKKAEVTCYDLPCYEYSIVDEEPLKRSRQSDGKLSSGRVHRLAIWLDELGLMGKKSADKTIANEVWSWDKESIAQFLSGLLEADGCISQTNSKNKTITINLAMTAEQVVREARELLSVVFGVHGTQVRVYEVKDGAVKSDKMPNLPKSNHPMHQLNITGYQSVMRLFDQLPCDVTKMRGGKQLFSETNYELKQRASYGLVSSRVVGDKQVYDLAVKSDDHLYVLANGLIVSNSKLIKGAAHRLVVTKMDDEEKYDPSQMRGLVVDTEDGDNVGSLLAHDVGPYKRNTVLTPKILRHLAKLNHKEILVRSPITTDDTSGGVYARDVGVRDSGDLPLRGDMVGVTASDAISEPVTQSALCLAKGTLVRMENFQVKPIEEIEPGEMVMGADKDGNAFPVKVLRRFDNGKRECNLYSYRFPYRKDSVDLVCTPDHKILQTRVTTGQKSDVDNYKPMVSPASLKGNKVYAIPPQSIQVEGIPGPGRNWSFLVGHLLGDGCYTKSVGNINFSCADPLLVEAIAEAGKEFGLRPVFRKGSECYYSLSSESKGGGQCPVTGRYDGSGGNPMKRWLIERGMYGKYAHEKELPPLAKYWDEDSLRGLLQGLFASDGSVYLMDTNAGSQLHISFASTSRKLVEQIKWALIHRLGVYVGSIHTAKKQEHRNYSMHEFSISHVSQTRKLMEWLQDIPGVRGSKAWDALDKLSETRQIGEYYFMRRFVERPVGSLPTFDLEVDHPDHLFVLANGLIVSNSAKHKGGAVDAKGNRLSGFELIDKLFNPPKNFRDAATHAETDGRVRKIEPATQGGHYVYIGEKSHYVPKEANVTVKEGQVVEAGDQLSDGFINPRMVVQYKGLGEGARQLAYELRRAIRESGTDASRRNLELVTAGLVNRVRMTKEFGDYVPEDIVPYNRIAQRYKPRKDSQTLDPDTARNQYLERPVMHYTIGTRITPSVSKRMRQFGVKQIVTHAEPPPFEPAMVRAADLLQTDEDWMTRQLGTGLQKGLLEATHRGRVSDENSTSFVPSRAAATNFGKIGPIQHPTEKQKPLPSLGYQ